MTERPGGYRGVWEQAGYWNEGDGAQNDYQEDRENDGLTTPVESKEFSREKTIERRFDRAVRAAKLQLKFEEISGSADEKTMDEFIASLKDPAEQELYEGARSWFSRVINGGIRGEAAAESIAKYSLEHDPDIVKVVREIEESKNTYYQWHIRKGEISKQLQEQYGFSWSEVAFILGVESFWGDPVFDVEIPKTLTDVVTALQQEYGELDNHISAFEEKKKQVMELARTRAKERVREIISDPQRLTEYIFEQEFGRKPEPGTSCFFGKIHTIFRCTDNDYKTLVGPRFGSTSGGLFERSRVFEKAGILINYAIFVQAQTDYTYEEGNRLHEIQHGINQYSNYRKRVAREAVSDRRGPRKKTPSEHEFLIWEELRAFIRGGHYSTFRLEKDLVGDHFSYLVGSVDQYRDKNKQKSEGLIQEEQLIREKTHRAIEALSLLADIFPINKPEERDYLSILVNFVQDCSLGSFAARLKTLNSSQLIQDFRRLRDIQVLPARLVYTSHFQEGEGDRFNLLRDKIALKEEYFFGDRRHVLSLMDEYLRFKKECDEAPCLVFDAVGVSVDTISACLDEEVQAQVSDLYVSGDLLGRTRLSDPEIKITFPTLKDEISDVLILGTNQTKNTVDFKLIFSQGKKQPDKHLRVRYRFSR